MTENDLKRLMAQQYLLYKKLIEAGGRVSFCHSKQARLAPFSYLYTRVLARTRCKYTEFL